LHLPLGICAPPDGGAARVTESHKETIRMEGTSAARNRLLYHLLAKAAQNAAHGRIDVRDASRRAGLPVLSMLALLHRGVIRSYPSTDRFVDPMVDAASLEEWLKRPKEEWPTGYGVYFVRCADYVKIGVASEVQERVRAIQTHCPYLVSLLYFVVCGNSADSFRLEKDLHRKFAGVRHRHEWFVYGPEIEAEIATRKAGRS
jgi:hypothetical protein